MKKFLKILGWSLLVLLLVGAYAGYRIVWGHPFTINQLANRQAVFFLVRNPELFTTIGLVDGTPLDRHSAKLAPVGVEKRDLVIQFRHSPIEKACQSIPELLEVMPLLERARHGIEFFGFSHLGQEHWKVIKAAKGMRRLAAFLAFMTDLTRWSDYRLLSSAQMQGMDMQKMMQMMMPAPNDPTSLNPQSSASRITMLGWRGGAGVAWTTIGAAASRAAETTLAAYPDLPLRPGTPLARTGTAIASLPAFILALDMSIYRGVNGPI